MGLLDALTGNAAASAAKKNQAVLAATSGQATNAINGAYGNAINALTDLNGAGPSAITALNGGFNQARGDLGSQYGQTQGFLGQLQGLYGGQTAIGLGATNSLQDALGQNGAEGLTRATTAFENSLGRNAGLDTGLDAVMRLASARGNLAGGNTTRDLFNYGADYQNKQAGDYLTRLSGLASNYGQGLAGQAAGLTGQAGASQTYGQNLGSLGTGLGLAQGGVYGQAAGLLGQQGQGLANVQTSLGQSLMQNNNNLAASQGQASANFLDALGGAFTGFSKAGGISGIMNLFK